jgi:hypothetical protein
MVIPPVIPDGLVGTPTLHTPFGNAMTLGLELTPLPLGPVQFPKVAVAGETVSERTTGGARFTVDEFDPLVAAEAGTAIRVAASPSAPAATAMTLDL